MDPSTKSSSIASTQRTLGLIGATGVGVGAIVGGGILALAGTAFATTGPAAIVAFALNGVIAMLTALSFAEMASKFPESGGTYAFSRKVMSVEAAFTVGWVVWFASIVAAVLYAIGFAYFASVMLIDLHKAFIGEAPVWLSDSRFVTGLAVASTVMLAVSLIRSSAGGGQWINVAKVVVFFVLIIGGFWAVFRQPGNVTFSSLKPFFAEGFGGVVQAMGYTFIALQGFDLIAAVGGEVKNPTKTIPRAMILSLIIALVIYLPLLFVVTTVGTVGGESIQTAAANNPEGIVALAAQNFLGAFGYWLVIIAAVLSMFSALQANLFAASRIARSMAQDRTLPSRLSRISSKFGTPTIAIAVTALLVSVILLVLPDVGSAGAASSLIFLMTFALAHWIAILVRQRSGNRPAPFRVPLFPLVPVIGGLACIGLAIFQGIAVPSAGMITVTWLGIGGVLFLTLFASRARVRDASSTALDPELVTLRGRNLSVLVPIANPKSVEAMMTLADALIPANVGRVLMQTVVVAPPDWQPDVDPTPIERAQAVVGELTRVSVKAGIRVESLMTVAPKPLEEIARVARQYQCGSVMLGMSELSQDNQGSQLETLLGTLDANVIVIRSRADWQLKEARKILIPIAGSGGHEQLLALLLGSLLRDSRREATFLRVLRSDTDNEDLKRARHRLRRLADDVQGRCLLDVVAGDNAIEEICERADNSDLLILGAQRLGKRKKLFGAFTLEIARRTSCPIIIISRRG